MKYFEVKWDDEDGWRWSFQCKEEGCDTCKLRFVCFTSKVVTVVNCDLVDLLNKTVRRENPPGAHYSIEYSQKRARKLFFEYLVGEDK